MTCGIQIISKIKGFPGMTESAFVWVFYSSILMALRLSIEMRVVEDDEIVASLCESGKPLEVSAPLAVNL